MRYRKLDQNSDYTFGGGQADFFKDSVEGVAQAVKTRLLLWREEWFLDTDEGTPYLQGIIGKHDQTTIDNVVRSRILDTEGVTGIADYQSTIDHETRKLSVSVTIDTIYGTTQIQVAA
jgi:hypothetical protein